MRYQAALHPALTSMILRPLTTGLATGFAATSQTSRSDHKTESIRFDLRRQLQSRSTKYMRA
ncbi:hypothetical protein BST30_18655 [Mycobacterium mantenii]|uniref:Uncharacterized protein n=1 Tax=Mycobacterium mantenii TaxID=560555 RepID=A0A1X0FN90_MYCNT|nr:hypothetical protein BST30_18655 [Mycobacterium mantenii]